MSVNQLLSAGAWGLDVAFFVILILGIFIGVKRGFIAGICKIAGTVFSVAVALIFCISFQETLENWFGLTTALNNAVKEPIGEWIAVVISFILLLIFVKLGAWLVGKLGTWLVSKFAPFRIVNLFLGGILGLFKGALLIFALLAVCLWIPSDTVHEFISSSAVVGKIFTWDWFIEATKISIQAASSIVPAA